MLDNFFLANLSGASSSLEVASRGTSALFEMKTCQRWLICGMCENFASFKISLLENGMSLHQEIEFHQGPAAYQYLLEVVCGLKSRLIGEHEIVKQFKDAYRQYLESTKVGNSNEKQILSPIIEKILQDSKKLRTHFLTEIGQQSYASIAHKELRKEKISPMLIIGAGKLADELVAYFIKKRPVFITARNISQIDQLKMKYPSLKSVAWGDKSTWLPFNHILNTVGASNFTILDDHFFDRWNPLATLIDFGAPSSVVTNRKPPHFYSLQDIFSLGALSEEQKLSKVAQAQAEIVRLVQVRSAYFAAVLQKESHQEVALNSEHSVIKPSYVSY
jgi:glutamyl-tRNA reductase